MAIEAPAQTVISKFFFIVFPFLKNFRGNHHGNFRKSPWGEDPGELFQRMSQAGMLEQMAKECLLNIPLPPIPLPKKSVAPAALRFSRTFRRLRNKKDRSAGEWMAGE
jgi:hypothetical protein